MHEQSLVRSLLKQVETLRCEYDGGYVSEVRVEKGPLSGVESFLLSGAFELLSKGTAAEDAILVIDEVPLMAKCKLCSRDFEINNFVFRCPVCSGNVKVTRGDEFHLISVSFSEEPIKNERAPGVGESEQASIRTAEEWDREANVDSSADSCLIFKRDGN